MNTKEARTLVRDYEEVQSGINRLSDCGVQVVNVRVRKTKVVADVIHLDYTEKTTKRTNDVEFPIADLENFRKQG